MLGRRGVGRRHRQHMRDRADSQSTQTNQHPTYQPSHLGTYVTKQKLSQPSTPTSIPSPIPYDGNVPITFNYPDPHHKAQSVVLVGSFDAYLHHRMQTFVSLVPCPRAFTITLRIPPGSHTYKFLVDGSWCTHPALSHNHPIESKDDGVKHHRLVITLPADMELISSYTDRERDRGRTTRGSAHLQPVITMSRLNDGDLRSTVFRSASASAVPPPHVRASLNLGNEPEQSSGVAFQKQTSTASLHEPPVRRMADAGMSPRGSSFTAAPPVGGISHTQAVNRKSLLLRVGSGWLRRFSNKGDDMKAVSSDRNGGSQTPRPSQDKSGSGLFRLGNHHANAEDKENNNRGNRGTFTPERRKHATHVRGSARTQPVQVSRPTKVDEPKDSDEVNRQADNWRQMARHLQDDLFDPTAARELFTKAIHHREKHGLWCTAQNAQVHVDLARNLSKAEKLNDAEFHLRIAMRIYNQTDASKEHIADLMLYVGVVVDRQRRRAEAEQLYRDALNMYKDYGIFGNNVEIAVKNLSLNLRKQNREKDVQKVSQIYADIKKAAAAAKNQRKSET